MRHFFTISILLMFFASSTLIAQINWTKHPNPVLTPGPAGAWDEEFVAFPSVLFDGSIYHMWYGNYNYVTQVFEKIGYATSNDGITWTKYNDPATTNPPFAFSDPVLNPGSSGSYDDVGVNQPCVRMINNIYHMWYTGDDDPAGNAGSSICHATSSDGIIWTKDLDNPVLDVGSNGTWDDVWVTAPDVVFDGSIYHMWYCAWNGISNIVRIGHATSPHPDSSWTKDPNNPVLDRGSSSSWDYDRVDAPSVVYDGFRFHMFYSGGMYGAWRIGYAWSTDGSNWTKYDSNPVLDWGEAGTFDDISVSHCSVNLDTLNNIFKMWYLGADTIYGNHISGQIGYATAPVSIIHVPGNLSTIQEAIDSASDGNIVLVADGTYPENINFKGKAITVASHYYFDGDTSHISNTIIDGSQSTNPDSGSTVYFVSGEDTNSVLCGFTISGGTGTYELDFYPQNNWRSGGGIYCTSGGKIRNNKIVRNTLVLGDSTMGGGILAALLNDEYLIIEDNTISSNNSLCFSSWGGGIFSFAVGQTHVRISNNIVSDNVINAQGGVTAGAGIAVESDDTPNTFTMIGNTISNNQASTIPASMRNYGAGIHIWNAPMRLAENKIINNSVNSSVATNGVAIRMYSSSGSIIENNLISGNHALGSGTSYGAGIYLTNSSPLIQNNLIINNRASIGGGLRINSSTEKSNPAMKDNMEIYSKEFAGATHRLQMGNIKITNSNSYFNELISEPVIINNTIVQNIASVRGGGIASNASNPKVINSILWSDSTSSGAEVDGPATIHYSDIKGGYTTGTGNINADPLFFGSVFNLSPNSMCVGTGIDSILGYQAPPYDYDGDPRPNSIDEFVDMGAQESNFPNGIIKEDSDHLPKVFSLKQNYPNPFNPITNIEFSIPKSEFVTLKIYNLLGQEVSTLVFDKLTPGEYKYTWDASQLASGVYIYKLEAGNFIESRKLILMK